MFEGFLEKFLLKYFGEYLRGIDKSNLSIAVWKGEISISTVDINPEVLKKMNIPLNMIYGKICSMLLKVPWNNLSGKPVEIEIDSIHMVLSAADIESWYSNKQYIDYCMQLVAGVADETNRKLEEEFEKQEKKSTFFEQIFDNLLISVKNIHIRVESGIRGAGFCFGGILEDFNMKSVDEKGKQVFVKRENNLEKVTKMISFKNLILYHDSKTIYTKDVNIIDYYFKSKKYDFHTILNLSIDILFTLNPFNRETRDTTIPIYQLKTDISNIKLNFETTTIRDMTELLEYFGNFKQSKIEYLEKQKYNYLKPQKKISQGKDAKEKKSLVKEWFRFACKCIKLERRSKMSGVYLFVLSEEKKGKMRQELTKQLQLRADGKMPETMESEFNWIIQAFGLKDITEIVRKFSYEAFKSAAKNKKKIQEITYEQINFFSLNELPDSFNYLEFKISLQKWIVAIQSEQLIMEMASNQAVAEYRARNNGTDIVLNISEVNSAIEHLNTGKKDIISYGKVGTEDIINLAIKKEKNDTMIFGRIRRIYLFYKREIFDVINKFIDVFEDSFVIGNTFSAGTQNYIQTSGSDTDKSNDIINVKIEAPIVLLPEGTSNMWIADLGTFDIRKDSIDRNPNRITILEGKKTKLYFHSSMSELQNLNDLNSNPNLVLEKLEQMNLIVSDLGFSVNILKTIIKAEIPTEQDKKVPTMNLVLEPFKVDLIPKSMESFFGVILNLSKDSSREKNWIEKVRKRSELSTRDGLEYNLGYEYWEKMEVYVENQMIHLVNKKDRYVNSFRIDQLMDMKIDDGEKFKTLILTFRYKKLEFRSENREVLAELQFKLSGLLNLIRGEQQDGEQDGEAAQKQITGSFSEDAFMGIKLQSIDLSIKGYHPEGVDFYVKLDKATYVSKYLDGVENGVFQLHSLNVLDLKDRFNIISIREEEQALAYNFEFKERHIDSQVSIKYIESTYKEQYIRSLIWLMEFILSNLMKEGDDKINEADKDKEISFEPQVTTTYSAKSTVKVSIHQWKAGIFYKKDLKCAELNSKNVTIYMETLGANMKIEGKIGDVGLYDLHRYPFRMEDYRTDLAMRIPMLQIKKGGFVHFNVTMNETDTFVETNLKNIVVDWVQQRVMRFIDFVMYQVLEIFYPSLFSFSKYYSKENIIRFSLSVLNDPAYVKQNITLESVEFNLCSTTNMDHKLGLEINKISIENSRSLINKVVNKNKLNYFPFEELESDTWKVHCKDVRMVIIDEGLMDEMADPQIAMKKTREPSSEYFDLQVEVDFLTKLFELSFLYDIVDDLENFDEENLKVFDKHFLNPPPGKPKAKPTVEDITSQAKHFIQQEIKEKLYLNGRYNIRIQSDLLHLHLTNAFINKIYAIISNNISFDDGKDSLFQNTYVNSTQGIPLYMDIRVAEFGNLVHDYNKREEEIFRLVLDQVHFIVNKKSTYVNLIDFTAGDLRALFSQEVQMNPEYNDFIRSSNRSADRISEQLDRTSDIKTSEHMVEGHMKLTPDYKKNIEVDFYGARVIVFSFITRLFPELMTLEPLVEHKGFEDPNFSLINIMMRMHHAEVCLVSNKESCVVVSGDIDYKINMDDKTSKHVIDLKNAEILDCLETQYLNHELKKIKKRSISRKFNFRFIMTSDIYFNASYELEVGEVLTKLTAFNLNTLSSVAQFQGEWDEKMLKYTLVDPKHIVVADYNTNAKFNLQGFSFVYVDNIKQIFLPVLRFDIKMNDFNLTQDKNQTKFGGTVEMKGNYNNSRTAKWEPFLENLFIDLSMNKKGTYTNLNIACGIEGTSEGIYLNFSEELADTVFHCIKNVNNVISLKHMSTAEEDEDTIIYDSQFLIRNLTGYDIFIQTVGDIKGDVSKVKNMSEKFMNFIIQDEFSTKDASNRDVILTFGDEIPEQLPIVFSVDTFKQTEILVEGFPIIISVKKEQLKRVAIISSRVLIQNFTSLPLEMMVFDQEGVYEKKQIQNDSQWYPVIFDKIKCFMTIGIESSVSSRLNLSEVTEKKRAKVRVPLVCQNESYNNIEMEVYYRGKVQFIDIKPSLRLISYLPIPLEFRLISKNFVEAKSIFKNDIAEIFKFNPYKEPCAIEVRANEQYSTSYDIGAFLSSKQKEVQIELKHSDPTNHTTIPINFNHNDKQNIVSVYSRFVVINETSLQLDFSSFNLSLPGKSLSMTGTLENRLFFQSNSRHDTVTIKANNKSFENYDLEFPASIRSHCFIPRNISHNINQKLKGGDDANLYEFDLAITPHILRLNETLLMKTITILPKYVFFNDTSFDLNLIQAGANQVHRIAAGVRWPVVWRTPNKSGSFQVIEENKSFMYSDMFEFNKPSYYELHVDDVENSSRKYFKVKVSSQDSVTYFHVSSLESKDLTKKIVNDTPYKLTIKSKTCRTEPAQVVMPGDSLYYAHKFPNKSGSTMTIQLHNSNNEVTSIDIDYLIVTTVSKYYELVDSSKLIQVSVRFIGNNKVIDIKYTSKQDVLKYTSDNYTNNVTDVRFAVNIVDVSLMCLRKKKPRMELGNIFLSNLMGMIEIRNNTNVVFAGFIENFQMDNNSDYVTSFPVVLRNSDNNIRKNLERKRFLEWNLAFENPSISSHLYFSNVAFVLGDIEAYFEEEYIDKLMKYSESVSARMRSHEPKKQYNFIQRKYLDFKDKRPHIDKDTLLWQEYEIDKNNHYIYIDNLSLPTIRCLLSYFQDPSSTYDKDFALVSLIGVAVGGFDNAPIELKGLHKE